MLLLNKGYVSATCEIKNTDNNQLLAIGFIKDIEDDYIIIGEKKDELKLIAVNTEVKVSIFSSKNGFRVLSGVVYTSTSTSLKIAELEEIVDHERRNYFRVDMDLEASVYFQSDSALIDNERYPAVIKDMSLNGVSIETGIKLELGNIIWIEFRLKTKLCCSRCKIVRIIEGNEEVPRRYGCEFIYDEYEGQLDRDLICSHLFQAQRDFLRKKK